MIEPLLCGIVLGLIPVTLMGLFVAALPRTNSTSTTQAVAADTTSAAIRPRPRSLESFASADADSAAIRDGWTTDPEFQ